MNPDERATTNSVEHLLARAFRPVDPPAHLYARVEVRLERVTFAAAEELADWELAAMRDPRNWVKPAVAVVAGAGAGTALLLMHTRRRRRPAESADALDALGSAFSAAARELARPGHRRADRAQPADGDAADDDRG